MAHIKDLNHFIEVLKTRLGEQKILYNKALGYRDCGVKASYYKGKIEELEYIINNSEKLQSKDKSE